MIVAILFVALLAYGCWAMVRMAEKASLKNAARASGSVGLTNTEDDIRWAGGDAAWTALDEIQLTRLLSDDTQGWADDEN